eukprot:scaffold19031_cov110-Isochrysis_galbana.AAC.3
MLQGSSVRTCRISSFRDEMSLALGGRDWSNMASTSRMPRRARNSRTMATAHASTSSSADPAMHAVATGPIFGCHPSAPPLADARPLRPPPQDRGGPTGPAGF